MRGWIMSPFYRPPARPPARGPSAADRAADDAAQLAHGVLEAIVDDDVRELTLSIELLLRGGQAPRDHVGVIGAAAHQPLTQRLAGRRSDEDLQRVGQRVADLPRPLDLDLEHHRLAGGGAPIEVITQRP